MLSFLPPVSQGAAGGLPGGMFEDDLLGQRARGFPLGHGLMSAAPQPAFPFAGFPMHPGHHDPMAFTGECLKTTVLILHLRLLCHAKLKGSKFLLET